MDHPHTSDILISKIFWYRYKPEKDSCIQQAIYQATLSADIIIDTLTSMKPVEVQQSQVTRIEVQSCQVTTNESMQGRTLNCLVLLFPAIVANKVSSYSGQRICQLSLNGCVYLLNRSQNSFSATLKPRRKAEMKYGNKPIGRRQSAERPLSISSVTLSRNPGIFECKARR